MDAINRAKRRFFLRPSYLARHAGDIARVALSKQSIVWQVLVTDAVRGARDRRHARQRTVARRPTRQRRLPVPADPARQSRAGIPQLVGGEAPIRLRELRQFPLQTGGGRAAARDTPALLSDSSCFRPPCGQRTRRAPRRPSSAVPRTSSSRQILNPPAEMRTPRARSRRIRKYPDVASRTGVRPRAIMHATRDMSSRDSDQFACPSSRDVPAGDDDVGAALVA